MHVQEYIKLNYMHPFSIQIAYQRYYYLSISNDILVLSNDKEMILYDIK